MEDIVEILFIVVPSTTALCTHKTTSLFEVLFLCSPRVICLLLLTLRLDINSSRVLRVWVSPTRSRSNIPRTGTQLARILSVVSCSTFLCRLGVSYTVSVLTLTLATETCRMPQKFWFFSGSRSPTSPSAGLCTSRYLSRWQRPTADFLQHSIVCFIRQLPPQASIH